MSINIQDGGAAVGRTADTSPGFYVSAAVLAREEARSDHLLTAYITACRLIRVIEALLATRQDPTETVIEIRRLFAEHATRVTGALDPSIAWPPPGAGVRS